mmetsp:Transcript_20504/g.58573  ORF Transcript_20504/g.58573 Transcript_20504/m.58573 type:complete len:208 (+) Transcript_20504:789-1412(+)
MAFARSPCGSLPLGMNESMKHGLSRHAAGSPLASDPTLRRFGCSSLPTVPNRSPNVSLLVAGYTRSAPMMSILSWSCPFSPKSRTSPCSSPLSPHSSLVNDTFSDDRLRALATSSAIGTERPSLFCRCQRDNTAGSQSVRIVWLAKLAARSPGSAAPAPSSTTTLPHKRRLWAKMASVRRYAPGHGGITPVRSMPRSPSRKAPLNVV